MTEPALPKNTITPEINYETEAYINTTPETEQPTWASMASIMKNMSQSLNEVLYQASYYADKGWGSTEVTGAQMTLTVTGDCKKETRRRIICCPMMCCTDWETRAKRI